jgi:hypothetical protein
MRRRSWKSAAIIGATLIAEIGYGAVTFRVLGDIIGPIIMLVIAVSTFGWPILFPLAPAGRLVLVSGWLAGAALAALTFAVVTELRPAYPLTAAAVIGVATASVSIAVYGVQVRREQAREAEFLEQVRRAWLAQLPKVEPEQ